MELAGIDNNGNRRGGNTGLVVTVGIEGTVIVQIVIITLNTECHSNIDSDTDIM